MTRYKITQLSLESDSEEFSITVNPTALRTFGSVDEVLELLARVPTQSPDPTFPTNPAVYRPPFPHEPHDAPLDRAAPSPTTEPPEPRTGERGPSHEPTAPVPPHPWAWRPAYARGGRVQPEETSARVGGSPHHMATEPAVPQPTTPRRPPKRTTENPQRIIPVGGNRSRHWTPEQEQYLLDQLQLGRSLDHIARYLDREPNALRQRLRVIHARKSTERVEPQSTHNQPNGRSGFSLPPAYDVFNGDDVTKENAPTD